MKKKFALTAAATLAIVGTAVYAAGAGAAERQKPPTAIATVAPLDLAGLAVTAGSGVTYVKNGATVTAMRDGAVVATMTLVTANYSATGGDVVVAVDAARPVVIDPQMFTVYDTTGGENSPSETAAVTVEGGRREMTLTYRDTAGRPEAFGWAAADGSAVWAR